MEALNNRHNIKSLLFDIVFDDERRAQELYDNIHRLHYQELEQVICRCLDEFVGAGAFGRLGEVELDLGVIHYRDLNSQIAQKVYDSLSEKLKELFKGVNTKERLRLSNSFTRIELIKHFLLEGYLPWNTKENVAALFANSLREEEQDLTLLLRDVGRSEKVRQRIISRFDAAMIFKIIEALSSTNSVLIHQFHRQLIQAITQNNVISLPKSKLEKEVWFFVLNHLLLHPPLAGIAVPLIKDTLTQFSDRFQVPFSTLLMLLADEVRHSKGGDISELKNIFTKISKGLNIKYLQKTNQDNKYIHLSFTEKTHVLIQLLLNKPLAANMENIRLIYLQQHLMQVLQSEPATIIDLLKDSKNASILIKRMISLFSIKPIYALIRSIETSHYKTIINFQQNIIHIHQKEPVASVTEKVFSDRLWEIIINLLMNRSGSYFNQMSFLKSVIGQLSDHYNIDYYDLIERLYQIAIKVSAKTSRMPVFIQLLSEIYVEHKQPDTKLRNKRAALSIPYAHSYEKKDSLNERNAPDFEEQKNRRTLQQYFLKADGTKSLYLIRRLLLEALADEPQLIIQTLKKQNNYITVVERLVHDFDGRVIQTLVKAIEPVYYQSVFDYQKNTLLVQNKKQVIHTSETELSDVLWSIILKMLLSRSSSKFNQKSFLKNLLLQTASHYNIKYLALIDQLCNAVNIVTSEKSKYHTFIQLVREIQEEENTLILKNQKEVEERSKKEVSMEKDKGQKTNKALLISNKSRVSESLMEMIVGADNKTLATLSEKGFANIEEAIQHLVLYQKESLINTLKKASASVVQTFISQLPTEAFEVLIPASHTIDTNRIQEFLVILNRRLYESGFQQRGILMQKVKVKCLYFLLKEAGSNPQKLLMELEQIIDHYNLPDEFWEGKETWKIPVDGNLDDNIRGLEERFSRELKGSLKEKSKTILLLEEILQSPKKQHTQVSYSKEKEILVEQEIYISNAGLVILNGYLHFFFQQCGFLNENGHLRSEKAKRAALVLQYVYNPDGVCREEELVLNKILCGLPINEVLPTDFEANDLEKNIAAQMLNAIIGHWKLVSNSTPEGFRESWLQREGRLTKKEKHWELLVEQRSFDILLDYKPFTISPVKFAWMKKPIKVDWR